MYKGAFPVILGFGVAGCVPVLQTVQPSADITVTDSESVPLENAKVFLATIRGPFGPRTLAEFLTDADGRVTFGRVRKWERIVFLPDGVSWYEWDLCVERVGFRALAVGEPEFREPIHVVLQATANNSECRWPESPFWKPEVVEYD
jgi:hypothetical protein